MHGHLCPDSCQGLGAAGAGAPSPGAGGPTVGGSRDRQVEQPGLSLERPVLGRCLAGLGLDLPAPVLAQEPLLTGSLAQALAQVTPPATEGCSGILQGQAPCEGWSLRSGLGPHQRTPESSSRPRQDWEREGRRGPSTQDREVGQYPGPLYNPGGPWAPLWCPHTCVWGKARPACISWQVTGCPPGPLRVPHLCPPSTFPQPSPMNSPSPSQPHPGRQVFWTLLAFSALARGVPSGPGSYRHGVGW